jgi:hypothetical protein
MKHTALKTNKEVLQELVFTMDLNASGLSRLEKSLSDLRKYNNIDRIVFHNIYFCLCEACFFLADPYKKDPAKENIRVGILCCSREVIADLELVPQERSFSQIQTKKKSRALYNIKWLSDTYWVNDKTDKISLAFKFDV